uniref:hypothetical protein n=1 Tax=Roseivirga sp. TaxID=1964215 RepID=UPI00404778A4
MKIKYKDLKSNKVSIASFVRYVEIALNTEVYFYHTKHLIAYEVLKLINFRGLKETSRSIEHYANKVLELNFLGNSGEKTIDYFLILTLDLRILPIQAKVIIEKEAKSDLNKVESVLSFYRKMGFIKSYEESEIRPRNQDQKTILTFYKRALKKYNEILDYIINDLDQVAIDDSRHTKRSRKDDKLADLFAKTDKHLMYPYKDLIISYPNAKYDYEVDLSLIDHRLISKFKHKVPYLPFNLSLISSENEDVLNSELLENLKPLQSLEDLIQQVEVNPFLESRLELFNELKVLASQSLWYSFYALALPQVEGIFQEMINQTKSNQKPLTLPDKVSSISDFHDGGAYYFDYYQHYLPKLRNRFSHFGLEDNVKLKSFHLILDLRVLLAVFEDLESDSVKLNNMLKFDDLQSFRNVIDFAEYYRLVEVVRKDNADLINQLVIPFERKNLKARSKLTKLVKAVIDDFKMAKERFESNFYLMYKDLNSKDFHLFQKGKKEVVENIKNIKNVIEGTLFIITSEDYVLLLSSIEFFNLISKRLSKSGYGAFSLVEKFQKEESETIDVLSFIKGKTDPNIDYHFILTRDDWQHIRTIEKVF